VKRGASEVINFIEKVIDFMFGNKEERGAYHEIHGKNDEGSMIIVGNPKKPAKIA